MRSKVEKRMARETGRTQRELLRAVKLRKKLMTDDEKLIYQLRRVPRHHNPTLLSPALDKQRNRNVEMHNVNFCALSIASFDLRMIENPSANPPSELTDVVAHTNITPEEDLNA
jgi:hypothetical protein